MRRVNASDYPIGTLVRPGLTIGGAYVPMGVIVGTMMAGAWGNRELARVLWAGPIEPTLDVPFEPVSDIWLDLLEVIERPNARR